MSSDKSPVSSQAELLNLVRLLRDEVDYEGRRLFDRWSTQIRRESFRPSAQNLAHYLALRRQDRRDLQQELLQNGLSSLGRAESRVMPNVQAVLAAMSAIACENPPEPFPNPEGFVEGIHALERNTTELFGPPPSKRRVRVMVTIPSLAAQSPEHIHNLLLSGMDCARINCAHDGPEIWSEMIENIRSESSKLGRTCSILMDLCGPRARLGEVKSLEDQPRLHPGDHLIVARPGVDLNSFELPAAECLLTEAISQLAVGAAFWIDDGKVGCRVCDKFANHLELEIVHAPTKGLRLTRDKGVNFPGSDLELEPLTDRDLLALPFVAKYADLVGYSFVQDPKDIDYLLQKLSDLGDTHLGIIAKIETQRAVANLPEIIVRAAGQRALGVMIARGDLAVEIGWQRISEMQEEILWICEAAHVPVIWATQVLESLVKKGSPSRAEVTDAAMSERAECVMLNKGPFILQGMSMLNDVLCRMQEHQWKKMPRLRALRLWRY